MRIYLAKSNKADFDNVAILRKELMKSGHDIIEYKGGDYSSEPLEMSDACIMILDQFSETEPIIGRGLFEQANIMVFKTSKPCFVYIPKKEGIKVLAVHDTKVMDAKNWITYGRLILDQTEQDFNQIFKTANTVSEENKKSIS